MRIILMDTDTFRATTVVVVLWANAVGNTLGDIAWNPRNVS